jgi:nitrous oxide reductase accessory protein NosL
MINVDIAFNDGERATLSEEGGMVALLLMLRLQAGCLRIEPRTAVYPSTTVDRPVRVLCSMRIERGNHPRHGAWVWTPKGTDPCTCMRCSSARLAEAGVR